MSEGRTVHRLLSAWEARRDQGEDVPAEELCRDRPELLEQVRGHIEALKAFDEVGKTHDASQTIAAGGPAAPAGPRLPAVPGHEILGELGRGGMGVVYKARHVRLGRPVAVKTLLAAAHFSRDAKARFLAEAEAVARLRHPNIVQIYELGEADGLPYFTMELAGAGSLDARLDGTPWPCRAAASLVRALAVAAGAAHEAGVVHRDLKPANVLLEPDGTPKLSDFGLAKRFAEGEAGPARTRPGDVLGTPCYMAPEQARGEAAGAGPAADVYALGAILYECLTGRPPFRGATAIDTIQQLLTREPVPPSRLAPGLPRDLEAVCLRCLEKDPARRYGSAAALADDLARFLAGEPTAARPLGRGHRLGRWCLRNPGIAALAAALAASLLAGFVGMALLYLRAAASEREARLAQQEAEADFRRAVAAKEVAEQGLGALQEHYVATGRLVELMTVHLLDDPAFRSPLLAPFRERLLALGAAYFGGMQGKASPPGAPAGKDTLLPLKAQAALSLGGVLLERGEAPAALAVAHRGMELLHAARGVAPEDVLLQGERVRGHLLLARIAECRGDRTGAAAEARAAAAEARRLAGRPLPPFDRHQLARGQLELSGLLGRAGEAAEAEAFCAEARDGLEALVKGQPDAPRYREDLAGAWRAWADLLRGSKRDDQAEAAYRRALAVYRERRASLDSPRLALDTARTALRLAELLGGLGRRNDAVRLCDEAASDLERLTKVGNPIQAAHELAAEARRLRGTFERPPR